MGHKLTYAVQLGMSGLPPIATAKSSLSHTSTQLAVASLVEKWRSNLNASRDFGAPPGIIIMATSQWYECFKCRKVSMFAVHDDRTKCYTCGGTNVQLLSNQQVREGNELGVYFDIDRKIGARARPKKRR